MSATKHEGTAKLGLIWFMAVSALCFWAFVYMLLLEGIRG